MLDLKTAFLGPSWCGSRSGVQQNPAKEPSTKTGAALAWPGFSLFLPHLPIFGCSDIPAQGCFSPQWVIERGRPFSMAAWSQRLGLLGWVTGRAGSPQVGGQAGGHNPWLSKHSGSKALGEPVSPHHLPIPAPRGSSQPDARRETLPSAPRAPSPHHPLRQRQLQFLTAPSFLSHSSRPPAQKPGRERNKE